MGLMSNVDCQAKACLEILNTNPFFSLTEWLLTRERQYFCSQSLAWSLFWFGLAFLVGLIIGDWAVRWVQLYCQTDLWLANQSLTKLIAIVITIGILLIIIAINVIIINKIVISTSSSEKSKEDAVSLCLWHCIFVFVSLSVCLFLVVFVFVFLSLCLCLCDLYDFVFVSLSVCFFSCCLFVVVFVSSCVCVGGMFGQRDNGFG